MNMKKSIEIRPVCPFLGGKECISDGVTREVLWNNGTAHPCAFWDENTYNGVYPEEPCRIKRAVNRILKSEKRDVVDENTPIEVPWGYDKKE